MSIRLRAITPPGSYDYLVSLPSTPATGSHRHPPLILFLHGIAERGTNVFDVTRQGLPRLLTGTPDLTAAETAIGSELAERFVVIAPQCPHNEVWDDTRLLALLTDVSGKFEVDPARIYLTGLSMGGFGAWSLAMRYPERFAALAPVCGGGRLGDIAAATGARRAALQTLGVWAFHGALDRAVPLEESERMIEALKLAGATDVQLTVYPDTGHDAWTATYANRELYAWLLRHAR